MKNINKLSWDELGYICEQIPSDEVRKYFRAYPKDFNQIKPGYRAEKISDEDIVHILKKQYKKRFIGTFIEKWIDIWINSIDDYKNDLMNQGYSEDEAIIKIMPDCIFENNPKLYFKLINHTVSEEYIKLLKNSVSLIEKIEKENKINIEQINEKLKNIETKFNSSKIELEHSQKEIIELKKQNNKLTNEIEEKIKQLEEKDNETIKTSPVFDENNQENENEILNKLSSLLPMVSNISQNNYIKNKIFIIESKMTSEEVDNIDNLEDFEEGLEDNLNVIGYDDKISIEMAQIISFSICNHNPIIIGENATSIGQCLSATMNSENLSEIFVSVEGAEITELFNLIDSIKGSVILIHGIFDGYNVTLYNAVVSYLKNNQKDLVILLPIEGISVNMLPVGVFQHAFYINGDEGLTKIGDTLMQSFNILNEFIMTEVKNKDFRDKRKEFALFSDLLGNKQVNTYTLYLLKYGENLNENDVILKQIITVARILGKEESLNEIFHQNGINKGEELIKKFI